MKKQMLIDAVHPEETRVALVTNGRVDDFDFEPEGKKQLRGNIYLAKITRVEPSLQAAFVEYGGNRHGFLAFSEIHPDYYQLPQEDRDALMREAAEEAAAAAEAEDDEIDPDEIDDAVDAPFEIDDDDDNSENDNAGDEVSSEDKPKAEAKQRPRRRSRSPQRRYKIQEVIRRRQVLLVQVVKEERGNKGAALTTYLSLAGRYSVLMPNTPRGGGISRKIANGADRKRLKSIVSELEVPDGMGLIVRTAGAKRTKTEIKRDYDYLSKLWNNICEETLNSIAPCMINEEGDLVHRAMRDLYDKDVEEVLIHGEKAYKEAKDLAKLLMPSHAKKVQEWTRPEPLFVEMGVEEQLDQIFSPVVQMKSGGYLVINQTEALVAIDVNSGKSTRERNIEQTATRTNLEAAEEACRQMRLRDLAGLIVIDFIDMDENKNNRAVEKKLKDCMKLDRARVQYSSISQFGLMEISRQRRRAGLLQATSTPCPICDGTGRQRSIPSAALQLLRALEARVAGRDLLELTVTAPTDVAMYLLNNKRETISSIEEMAGTSISITSNSEILPGDFKLDAMKDPNAKRSRRKPARPSASETENEDSPRSGSRKRGGRGRSKPEDDKTASGLEMIDAEDSNAETSGDAETTTIDNDDETPKRKPRRRGRRGGRRRKRNTEASEANETAETGADQATPVETDASEDTPKAKPKRAPRIKSAAPEDGGAYLDGLSVTPDEMVETPESKPEEAAAEKPKRKRAPRRRTKAKAEEAAMTDTKIEAAEASEDKPKPKPKPKPKRRTRKPAAAKAEPTSVDAPATKAEQVPETPKKRGWWSRKKAG